MQTEKGKLVDPQNTLAVLRKYQFRFQKKYGQNFLIDPRVLEKMMDAAKITGEDCVLEIGPGIGTMTQALAERAGRVVAVEIDSGLLPILKETLAGYENVTVLCQDILKTDLAAISREYAAGAPLKVCANLPYYITTPIVMALLERHLPLRSITVMVQQEVAERMQAGPGTKDYGALSLAVSYYARARIAAHVPPNCFIPRPGVGSAVVQLDVREEPPVAADNEQLLFDLIHAGFHQRRKTLANAAGNAAFLPYSREDVQRALRSLSLPENIRGEALNLEQFAALSRELAGGRCPAGG